MHRRSLVSLAFAASLLVTGCSDRLCASDGHCFQYSGQATHNVAMFLTVLLASAAVVTGIGAVWFFMKDGKWRSVGAGALALLAGVGASALFPGCTSPRAATESTLTAYEARLAENARRSDAERLKEEARKRQTAMPVPQLAEIRASRRQLDDHIARLEVRRGKVKRDMENTRKRTQAALQRANVPSHEVLVTTMDDESPARKQLRELADLSLALRTMSVSLTRARTMLAELDQVVSFLENTDRATLLTPSQVERNADLTALAKNIREEDVDRAPSSAVAAEEERLFAELAGRAR